MTATLVLPRQPEPSRYPTAEEVLEVATDYVMVHLGHPTGDVSDLLGTLREAAEGRFGPHHQYECKTYLGDYYFALRRGE